jgi:hypothetical protein
MSIWHTCFRVSGMSYIVFLFADYVRPGFVSSVFHVHLWLIPLALSYLIILHHAEEKEAASVKFLGSLLLSLVLAFIVWRERLVFDDFFILALVAVLLLPFIMRNTLNKFSE